jgi:hypothetical protein
MLANKLKPFVGSGYVTCDSSEPKSIQELNEYGVRAVGAIKGKDSVNFGIQWLRQLEIIIHPKCKYTKQEFESYKWKQDKNGVVLPAPLDKNNHHVDCLIGETIVNTVSGDYQIKDLVGKTGLVYCYDETRQEMTKARFYDCRKTHENINVFEVTMEDGRSFTASATHPVLTQRGWVNVSDLSEADSIVCV